MIAPLLINANNLDTLRYWPGNYFDSIVTDPPYGLSFMGKKWDYDVPSVELWEMCLRVLKPGGHLLSFAGTRTHHRMTVNIEDAGFEIRDMIAWVYGSGFPKSLDVSKAIDKAAGADREVVGRASNGAGNKPNGNSFDDDNYEWKKIHDITAPATDAARQWEGWGTALKPALEPITLARKPFKQTVAANVLEWGTGGLNIDGCRVEGEPWKAHTATGLASVKFFTNGDTPEIEKSPHPQGRWPANLIHDGSDEVEEPLGDAARFFYCPKASKKDRNSGLDGERNTHSTVKPCDLMRYLCRLITPPGGSVLDPFMGSGSTGKAAILEGFHFTGIEIDPDYYDIAVRRATL